MDFETGEEIPDQETGETPPKPQINSETGEQEFAHRTKRKITFKIPSRCLKSGRDASGDDSPGNYGNVEAQAKIIFTDIKPNSPVILFLLPTCIFFIPAFTIILGVVEIVLHLWAHKKNKSLRSHNINDVYYQSPLHVFVSEFCASCRFETSKNRITKLQDRTRRKFIKYGLNYVKNMV